MNIHRSETAMLRDRIAQLEEELRQLRETFWTDDVVYYLRGKLGVSPTEAKILSPTEAKILSLLLQRDSVSTNQMSAAVHGLGSEVDPHIFAVYMTYIRRKTGLRIRNVRGIKGENNGMWSIENRKAVAEEIFKGKELPQ